MGLTTVHANNMMGDEDLEKLSRLDHVTSLDFSGSQFITDKGLQYLARMPQLRELRLSHYPGNGVTNHGLEVLQHLRDDEAMRHISALSNLRMLMAQGTVATDAGFKRLSQSKTIEYIWGRECPNLKSAGFAALAEMPALRGLASLATLPRLREFSVGNSPRVTRTGISAFPATIRVNYSAH